MGALTAVCWGIFFFTASLIDPTITNWFGLSLFYLALFLALSGTIAIFGFVFRFFALKKELAFNLVKKSFHQSFVFSLFIVILLVLKSNGLFNWLNLALLIIIFIVGELFFTGYRKTRG